MQSSSSVLDQLFVRNAETNDEFIRNLMNSLVLATKVSNEIPTGDEFGYFATSPRFAALSEECAESAAKLLKVSSIDHPISSQRTLPFFT